MDSDPASASPSSEAWLSADSPLAQPQSATQLLQSPFPLPPSSVSVSASDPLSLRAALKSPEDLARLESRFHRHGSKKSPVAAWQTRRNLRQFYEAQNELIESMLRVHVSDESRSEEAAAEDRRQLFLQIAIYGSGVANLLLFVLQLAAAISSNSLALFATMADSFMDLASSTVLILTGLYINSKRHGGKGVYPTGKKRFETAGIIVFSCIMGALSVQIVIEAVRTLAAKTSDVEISVLSLACVSTAIAVKLLLYIYCLSLSKRYQSARVLVQDHRNDIIFNSFGIALSVLGARVVWWIDPAGAILIALLILRSWSLTAFEHIQLLVGRTASPTFLSLLTYTALTHSPLIKQIDTVRAYHSGEGFFVEIDVVLDEGMRLREAHDVGESLQERVEGFELVERCFVHLDYESEHRPEHG